jgi:uncharacterized damage-inducible protein DinB
VSEYTLHEHLRRQLRGGFRAVSKAVAGLTEEQAWEGARPDWRRYRWGSGLDGSVAGIIWHVALWKQNFAQGLESGAFPPEESITPPGVGWNALVAWLADGQARLEAAFERLSAADLAVPRQWEGETAPLARLLSYIIEHDFYHAGQIQLLRQLRGNPNSED